MDVIGGDAYLIESGHEVHLRRLACALHIIDGVFHSGCWIHVLDGLCAEASTVHAETQNLIVFIDEQNASSERRLGSFDMACRE